MKRTKRSHLMRNGSSSGLLLEQAQKQLQYISSYSNGQLHFYVGVSGGADSLFLLLLFSQLQKQSSIQVTAVHVNHQLSPNAHNWQTHVETIADQFGIPCISESVNIQGANNLEAKAREARYGVFKKHCVDVNNEQPILVLGHHAQDMAEDFFLKLMRGGGPGALASKNFFEKHYLGFHVWRPLLSCSKQCIENELIKANIHSVFDESNLNCDFSRNYIRHKVLPQLQNRWPHVVSTIKKTQEWCRESERLAEDLAELDYSTLKKEISPALIPGLCLTQLAALPLYRFKNLLRYFLHLHHIEQIRESLFDETQRVIKSVINSNTDGQQPKIQVCIKKHIDLTVTSSAVLLYRSFTGAEYLSVDDHEGLRNSFGVVLNSGGKIDNKDYLQQLILSVPSWVLELSASSGAVWKVPASTEKLKLPYKPYAMTFKKLWSEWKIPVVLRSRWPVLYDHQEKIICVPMLWSAF